MWQSAGSISAAAATDADTHDASAKRNTDTARNINLSTSTHSAADTRTANLGRNGGTLSTAISITDAGPVNRWLAALDLSGERYAALGDPAAPITIIEFAGHGCPYCRFFALNTFPELRKQYIETGKVYYVYKDLPVVSAHGDLAAQAALCAGEQGNYWGMHHQLAIDTEDWNIGADGARAAFRRYAQTLQLDAAALDRCVVSEQYAPEVQLDTDSALRLGIRSTPIFIINDKVLIGTRPFETFDAILSAMLGS